jgi:hypothetical protein
MAKYDVFISLRLAEAGAEAKVLKTALEKEGLKVFLCTECPTPNEDLASAVVHALDACGVAVILGTATYGKRTEAGFSTFEELRFIFDENKPFVFAKMCDKFESPETRFRLSKSICYTRWMPSTPLPGDLVRRIKEKLTSPGCAHAAAVGVAVKHDAASCDSPTPNHTEAAPDPVAHQPPSNPPGGLLLLPTPSPSVHEVPLFPTAAPLPGATPAPQISLLRQ